MQANGEAFGLENGFKTKYSVAQLTAAGLTPTQPLGNVDQVSLLRLDVGTGYQYWYGMPNFYTITRYNHSTHYAMAVWQLGRRYRRRVSLRRHRSVSKSLYSPLHGEEFQKHFATLLCKRAIYISIAFHYCYVITFNVVSTCQRPFSLCLRQLGFAGAGDYRVYRAGRALGGGIAMIVMNELVAGYDRMPVTRALSGVIERGSMTAIIGANGCGKSTLLKTLAGFIPPVSGRFRWQEKRPVIGWLAQRHALEAQFPLTVQDVVSMGCWPCVALFRLSPETRSRIASALERVGLDAMALSTIDALSGGQFQRMLFARIPVQQAPLVMLDEPFTGVDEATCNVLMDLMLEMYMQGQTLLAVLHDSERVSRHFPQTLRLDTTIPHWKTERVRVA